MDWYRDRNIPEKRKDYESDLLYRIMCFEDRDMVSKWFAPLNVYCRMVDCYGIDDQNAWDFVSSKYNRCVSDIIIDEERLI